MSCAEHSIGRVLLDADALRGKTARGKLRCFVRLSSAEKAKMLRNLAVVRLQMDGLSKRESPSSDL